MPRMRAMKNTTPYGMTANAYTGVARRLLPRIYLLAADLLYADIAAARVEGRRRFDGVAGRQNISARKTCAPKYHRQAPPWAMITLSITSNFSMPRAFARHHPAPRRGNLHARSR